MTFQEKMTHAKMDRAAWLLRTSNKKIIEVAESVGYSSEAAFYQAFRKYIRLHQRNIVHTKNNSLYLWFNDSPSS